MRAPAENVNDVVLSGYGDLSLECLGNRVVYLRSQKKMNVLQPPYASFRALTSGINNKNPNSTEVYEAMLRATHTYVKVIKCRTRCYVLQTLKKAGIGTASVENLTKRLCSHPEKDFKGAVKDKIIRIVMRERLNDAYNEYRQSKREDNEVWRKEKKYIIGETRRGYLAIWRTYVGRVKKKLKEDADKKVDWLVTKWRRNDVPDMYEGIKIKTDDVPVFDNTPRLYGGVSIDENEKALLLLPPKFGLFEKIDVVQFRIQLEEALNKLRWNKLLLGDGKTKEPRFFDRTDKTIDINNMRATNLLFNPNVKMPGPIGQREEVKMMKFRNEVMQEEEEVGKGQGRV